VKAGGHELKSYLQQLLAGPERVQAATDIEEWARAQLTPSDQEITKLRTLIRKIDRPSACNGLRQVPGHDLPPDATKPPHWCGGLRP
jgi:hypothetical protein